MKNKRQNLLEKLPGFLRKGSRLAVATTEKTVNAVKRIISVELLACLLVNFAVIFASTCCFGGTERFSIDSYDIKNMGAESLTYIYSLRPFGALLFEVLNLLNHHSIHNTFPDFLVFSFLSAVSISIVSVFLYKAISKDKPSLITLCLIDAGALLVALNTYFADLLSFPECIFIHSVALSLTIFASIVFCRKNSLLAYFLVSLLVVLATATYQTYLFLFAILTATVMIATNNLSAKKILRFFAVLIVSGILYAVISILMTKLFATEINERAVFSISEIFKRVYDVLIRQKSYLRGRGTFNRRTLLYCFGALFALWFIAVIFSKQPKKTKLLNVCALVFCYCAVWIPNIISSSNGIRSVFSLFAIPLLLVTSSITLLNDKFMKYALLFIVSFMLMANVFRFNQIEIDLCKQNALDKEWAEYILSSIEEYENSSGIEIKNIAICNDEQEVKTYRESARYVWWADVSCINEFGHKNFVKVEMPQNVYDEYFKGKNWDVFVPEEQLVYIGDTLYICNY